MISRRMTAGVMAAALLLGACGDSDSDGSTAGDTESASELRGDLGDTQSSDNSNGRLATGGEEESVGGRAEEDVDNAIVADEEQESGGLSQDAVEDAVAETTAPAQEEFERASAAEPRTTLPPRIDRPTRIDPNEPDEPEDTTFVDAGVNPFVDADRDPQSTFGLDVDTASYTVGRSWIDQGLLPDPDSVRVEEWVNYFEQDYDPPRNETFAVYADGAPHPFIEDDTYLLRIGIAARDVSERQRDPVNLTFVVDTSGSMDQDRRIELVQESIVLLAEQLDSDDLVSIVQYSDSARVVLEPTSGRDLDDIVDAVWRLRTGGSTNAEAGLTLGYELADEMWDRDETNRVVLLSDGVANVGATGPETILERIGDSARRDIQLIAVGVGFGNFNDHLLEQLADQGDGWYAYVDSLQEAERIFVEDLVGSLQTVAEDAKVQVEFDPRNVESYRLIGFENRDIADGDFRNDRVDAGEVGAGHTVTALYEVRLHRSVRAGDGEDIATVYLRWLEPDARRADEVAGLVSTDLLHDRPEDASAHYRLTASAATFAEILRGSRHVRGVDVRDVLDAAEDAAR
ncbi:MAG: von Willebrand factor type A domain-containing protein, partial [Actinomycetota bacterium]|nr:von Willebrand factor type A domain-containing protein [Actinomycetota bacterium]